MKRIDLHIHTIATQLDSQDFEFDIEVLKAYIKEAKLDAIAVTNHNIFEYENYCMVKNSVDVPVFPGIELNVTKPGSYGHVLVIAPENQVQEFAACTKELSRSYSDSDSHLSWIEIVKFFPRIEEYLIFPHFDKHRQMDRQSIEEMKQSTGVTALEVENNKKWLKNNPAFEDTLVVFSDGRPGQKMPNTLDEETGIRYSYGFTYIECEEMKVPSIKCALTEKRNAAVIRQDNDLEILPEAVPVSKRLNVILGNRSSGKTYTLKRILDAYNHTDYVYIRQFEITSGAEEKAFKNATEASETEYYESYFSRLQKSLSDYLSIDFKATEILVGDFLEDLIVYANSPEDSCSKCPIYNAEPFSFEKEQIRQENDFNLLKAINLLRNDKERKDLINNYISNEMFNAVEQALSEAIEKNLFRQAYMRKVNEICETITAELGKISARKPLPSKDPVKKYYKDKYYESKFVEVLSELKKVKCLESQVLGKFKKERIRKPNTSSAEAKETGIGKLVPSGTNVRGLFNQGVTTVQQLRLISSFDKALHASAFKFLFHINTSIVNNNAIGTALSGGQRAEYVFLDKLNKAKTKDLVLIDEPESSFDNPFLSTDILDMLNKLADETTVFMVTHNNTLGVSVKPDKVIYAEKDSDDTYNLYYGATSSEFLRTVDGKEILTRSVLLNSMEAGIGAYEGRKKYYGLT